MGFAVLFLACDGNLGWCEQKLDGVTFPSKEGNYKYWDFYEGRSRNLPEDESVLDLS